MERAGFYQKPPSESSKNSTFFIFFLSSIINQYFQVVTKDTSAVRFNLFLVFLTIMKKRGAIFSSNLRGFEHSQYSSTCDITLDNLIILKKKVKMSENNLWEIADRMANAYRESAALFCALEIGLFDYLRETPQYPQQLGQNLSVAPRRLRILLDLLAFHGFITRENGKYFIAREWQPLTDPEREDNLQSRFAHTARNARSWFRAADVLEKDKPASELPPPTLDNDARIADFHRSLGTRGLAVIEAIADLIELPDAAQILDVGGGYGDLCRPFFKRYPNCSATLFESADTIALAKDHHRNIGLSERFQLIGGDFLKDEIPDSRYDLIILSNILHIYSPETNKNLLAKLLQATKPDGRIIIREINISEDATGPQSGLQFAMNMAINTQEGDAYPHEVVSDWMKVCGWQGIQELFLPIPSIYILLGHRHFS